MSKSNVRTVSTHGYTKKPRVCKVSRGLVKYCSRDLLCALVYSCVHTHVCVNVATDAFVWILKVSHTNTPLSNDSAVIISCG